ncbi:MAG: glycosyltransferase [Solirubrobacterales bacterium]
MSVIVPFKGTEANAQAVLRALATIRTRPGDELIVADNSDGGVVPARPGVTVVRVTAERSSYHARNVGAEASSNGWLLFLDADCLPQPEILDAYLASAPGPGVGAIGGEVRPAADQDGLLVRYARSRCLLSQQQNLRHAYRPAAVTANLLVRRAAWEALGGFAEGIRSGGDGDFCWRLQDDGWALDYHPEAWVEHLHRERLGPLLRQLSRHARGAAWLNRRHPGSSPRPRVLRPLGRSAAGAVGWALAGRFERARLKAVDAAVVVAIAWGYLRSNEAPAEPAAPTPAGSRRLAVLAETFPARSETFVYNEVIALREAGWDVRVEAGGRPARPERSVGRRVPVRYLEDDALARKARDLVWLVARHPAACARDLLARRRWAPEPVIPLRGLAPTARRLDRAGRPHLHAHFAATAALNAMRLSAILGTTYSVSTHAFELFRRPANLPEKLAGAAFTTGECDYTVDHLREVVAEEHRPRIVRLATGTNPDRIRRRGGHPGDGTVVAIGRLVEKKGFAHLVDAADRLRHGAVARVVIAGDGPLRAQLEARVAALGLDGLVELRGNVWGAEAVRTLLETADLMVIPSVIAADGDRDALPVVSYEALAMEVPIVASDLVGLPEVVRPGWGRLVPPGDPASLAAAIEELLELPAAERAAMGAAARAYVVEHGDQRRQAERLAELIEAAT